MCLAVPGKIINKRGSVATVEMVGNRLQISTTLVPDVGVGEWVLVHAGFAIAVIEEDAARETWSILQEWDETPPFAQQPEHADVS